MTAMVWDELLHVDEDSVWADKDYVSAEPEAAFIRAGVQLGVHAALGSADQTATFVIGPPFSPANSPLRNHAELSHGR